MDGTVPSDSIAFAFAPAPEAPKPARRSRRSTPSTPAKSSRSQYAINADVIAAGRLPENPPVVTSKANPHYQKRFDTLHGFAAAGDWDAVRGYKVTGSNSYSGATRRTVIVRGEAVRALTWHNTRARERLL